MNQINNCGSSFLILLTGCINPNGMSFTSLQDQKIRASHYIEAIHFYLKATDCKILFVENSGIDISAEFVYNNRLEFLTFLGNDYDKSLGKGYGEMLILKYAFKESKFIKATNVICKITGRYKIKNILPILKSYNLTPVDVMVDLPKQLSYGDSRIYIADRRFFQEFLFHLLDEINDSAGVYFEHVLNKAVLLSIMQGFSYLPLKYKPRIMGQSGTDNLTYNDSYFYWLPRNIKKIISFKIFRDDETHPYKN